MPNKLNLTRRQAHVLEIILDGYQPAVRHTDIEPSTVGIVDLIGTSIFLLPALGWLTPGAWKLRGRCSCVSP